MSPLLFQIPVYRTAPERHAAQVSGKIDATLAPGRQIRADLGLPEAPQEEAQRTAPFIEREFFRGGWDYNQTIGWLEIEAWASRLDAYYWRKRATRFSWRGSNRPFEWMGKAFELTIPASMPSTEILATLQHEMDQRMKERPFQNRHVDRRAFDYMAPRMDWRAIMDDAASHWGHASGDAAT